MSKPAARVGDMHTCPMVTPGTPPVPHVGGPILPPGQPTVLIAGLPAARQGDRCTCVGPPDVIVTGSPTVFIGGIPAARVGDMTAHGGVITVGCPTVLIGDVGGGGAGSLQARTMSAAKKMGAAFTEMKCDLQRAGSAVSDLAVVPTLLRTVWDQARDGKVEGSLLNKEKSGSGKLGNVKHKLDVLHGAIERNQHGAKVEGGVGKMESSITGKRGGATHRLDVLHAAMEMEGKVSGKGAGARASVEGQMLRRSASMFAGDDPNNPFLEVGGSYEVASAEAEGEFLLGSDGRRSGFIAQGSAGARLVSGEVSGERNVPIPFTSWSISFRGKASGEAGGGSVSAGAHAYVDHKEQRFHLGASGKVAALLGAGFDFNISIGRKYQSRERGSY